MDAQDALIAECVRQLASDQMDREVPLEYDEGGCDEDQYALADARVSLESVRRMLADAELAPALLAYLAPDLAAVMAKIRAALPGFWDIQERKAALLAICNAQEEAGLGADWAQCDDLRFDIGDQSHLWLCELMQALGQPLPPAPSYDSEDVAEDDEGYLFIARPLTR